MINCIHMYRQMLLDEKPFAASIDQLPCLIHGADHSGASLFTVSYVADLYQQGAKFIFLSGYHMARDEFNSQTEDPETSILIQSREEIPAGLDKRTVFIPREKADLFVEALDILPDIQERIILVKNIELFDVKIFEAIRQMKHIVLSGDIDKCAYKQQILSSSLQCKIVFSEPVTNIGVKIPALSKYQAYLATTSLTGTVRLAG